METESAQLGQEVKCDHCGSTELEVDPQTGTTTCSLCGYVLTEHSIQSNLTFSDSAGGSNVVGQFVPSTGAAGLSSSARGGGAGTRVSSWGRESREVTITNGKKRMKALAAKLRLSQHHVDAALRLFMLAVQHNFVQGRKTQHVVAACLYIVCRRERTPHMLMDFADVLQTNLYVLGATFVKFIRLLHLSLPLVDPSLYVHRFADKLDLGDSTHAVGMSALRLLSRMKRDWLQCGRRPEGLCGAALLLALRLHGFQRTFDEVIRVVKVCNATLRFRLNEFVDTPAANLSYTQLIAQERGEHKQGMSLESAQAALLGHEEHPPAYRRLVSQASRQQRKVELIQAYLLASEAGPVDENQHKELQGLVGGMPLSTLSRSMLQAMCAADAPPDGDVKRISDRPTTTCTTINARNPNAHALTVPSSHALSHVNAMPVSDSWQSWLNEGDVEMLLAQHDTRSKKIALTPTRSSDDALLRLNDNMIADASCSGSVSQDDMQALMEGISRVLGNEQTTQRLREACRDKPEHLQAMVRRRNALREYLTARQRLGPQMDKLMELDEMKTQIQEHAQIHSNAHDDTGNSRNNNDALAGRDATIRAIKAAVVNSAKQRHHNRLALTSADGGAAAAASAGAVAPSTFTGGMYPLTESREGDEAAVHTNRLLPAHVIEQRLQRIMHGKHARRQRQLRRDVRDDSALTDYVMDLLAAADTNTMIRASESKAAGAAGAGDEVVQSTSPQDVMPAPLQDEGSFDRSLFGEFEDPGPMEAGSDTDAEISKYLCSRVERANKEKVWLKLHAGFLERQRLRREALEAGEADPNKRRRTKNRAHNATDAAAAAFLNDKKRSGLSTKINYDLFKSLVGETRNRTEAMGGASSGGGGSVAHSLVTDQHSGEVAGVKLDDTISHSRSQQRRAVVARRSRAPSIRPSTGASKRKTRPKVAPLDSGGPAGDTLPRRIKLSRTKSEESAVLARERVKRGDRVVSAKVLSYRPNRPSRQVGIRVTVGVPVAEDGGGDAGGGGGSGGGSGGSGGGGGSGGDGGGGGGSGDGGGGNKNSSTMKDNTEEPRTGKKRGRNNGSGRVTGSQSDVEARGKRRKK